MSLAKGVVVVRQTMPPPSNTLSTIFPLPPLWVVGDLKQNTMEITKINPEEFGVQKERADELVTGLKPYLQERELLIQEFDQVKDLELTEENTKVFKSLRLKFRDNRTKGILKWHKSAKEIPLRLGQLLDAIKRTEVEANEAYEKKLEDGEKHFERLEEQRLAALQAQRVEQLLPYVEDAEERDLSSMEQDVWEAYLAAKKAAHEERIAAERKAEEERQRQELIAQIRSERQEFVAPVYDFFKHGEDLGEMRSADFTKRLEAARKAKAEHQAEQERIKKERQELEAKLEAERQEQARKEAERKKAEQAAAEKARKEREAAEAKAKAERERHERELQVERDRIAKIEAEAKAQKEAEEKAAKAAAMAPDKDKLLAYAQAIVDVPTPSMDSQEMAELANSVRSLQEKIMVYVKSKLN